MSHRQSALVRDLLDDIAARVTLPLSVVVTVNVPEPMAFAAERFRFPVDIVHNPLPKGFGANHNAAFRRCRAPFFCILNPDVRLPEDPFSVLLGRLAEDPRIGLIAPLIRDPRGGVEATSRRFPTPVFILRKALLGPPRTPDYRIDRGTISPDWVGGMFMLLRAEAFARIHGFDERYFMYYEDVDLCARLRCAGFDVLLDPAASAIHAARRDSHRRPRYFLWHLRSMVRFWLSDGYAALRRRSSLESSTPQTKNEKTPG